MSFVFKKLLQDNSRFQSIFENWLAWNLKKRIPLGEKTLVVRGTPCFVLKNVWSAKLKQTKQKSNSVFTCIKLGPGTPASHFQPQVSVQKFYNILCIIPLSSFSISAPHSELQILDRICLYLQGPIS